MRERVAAALVAALVALAAARGVASAAPPATIAASRDVMDSLPRDDDDDARRRLRCNACAAACDALVRDLARERARRGGTLTRALADATMEATCARAGEELGLTMRDGRVTETFAEDDGTARARGRWITVYAREACARLIDGEHDDALMTFGKRDDGGARMEAREALCHARTGTCESASAARAANELEARDRRDREL